MFQTCLSSRPPSYFPGCFTGSGPLSTLWEILDLMRFPKLFLKKTLFFFAPYLNSLPSILPCQNTSSLLSGPAFSDLPLPLDNDACSSHASLFFKPLLPSLPSTPHPHPVPCQADLGASLSLLYPILAQLLLLVFT